MRTSHLSSLAITFALLAGTSLSQSVRVVATAPGPGVDFIDLQAACDAALEGDIVLVKPGNYSGTRIDGKSLTIVADTPGTVTLTHSFGFANEIVNLAPNQSVRVRGIRFTTSSSLSTVPTPGLRVANCAGSVYIEKSVATSATIQSGTGDGGSGMEISNCRSVILSSSSCFGGNASVVYFPWIPGGVSGSGGHGISVSSSTVHLFDGNAVGGNGHTNDQNPGGNGGDGLLSSSAVQIFASGCSFVGGAGGGSNAMNGGDGGHGIVTSNVASILDCMSSGGAGGLAPIQGAAGASVFGSFVVVPGTARSFSLSSPVREAAVATITAKGLPLENVATLLSDGLGAPLSLLPSSAPLLLSLTAIDGFSVGALDAGGDLSVGVTIPSFVPALQGRAFFLQPVFYDSALTYAVLGPVASLTVLDSAF
ncbi:MAG: hypothetical protein JNJ88_18145 [Planctomycetes bacterium]|nr:hypothetical protein [Planctomycetota bacterium]